MHILASGPELHAVKFMYVILGENLKKGLILKRYALITNFLPLQERGGNRQWGRLEEKKSD
jgi:hypothetical protein